MIEQLPKRPRAHVLEELSFQHLRRILPSEWICRRVEDDYGLDVRVEIVAGEQVTAQEFSVQLKATDHLQTSGDDIVHRCKVTTAQYFLRRPEPVMYVVYSAQETTSYWLWVRLYLEQLDKTKPDWREKQSVQIRIPCVNRLTRRSIPSIADQVQTWWARVIPFIGWEHVPNLKEGQLTELPSSVQRVSLKGLRVFLCHSSDDKLAMRNLYHKLRNDDIDPWLAEEKLLPGQNWRLEITKAVRTSEVVLVCLSRSFNKAGYVQKEVKMALDVADEQPEGAIFVIPVRLEECDVPERLSRWHWVDLFSEGGYEHLLLALQARASVLDQ
jgi:hypothetical protein